MRVPADVPPNVPATTPTGAAAEVTAEVTADAPAPTRRGRAGKTRKRNDGSIAHLTGGTGGEAGGTRQAGG